MAAVALLNGGGGLLCSVAAATHAGPWLCLGVKHLRTNAALLVAAATQVALPTAVTDDGPLIPTCGAFAQPRLVLRTPSAAQRVQEFRAHHARMAALGPAAARVAVPARVVPTGQTTRAGGRPLVVAQVANARQRTVFPTATSGAKPAGGRHAALRILGGALLVAPRTRATVASRHRWTEATHNGESPSKTIIGSSKGKLSTLMFIIWKR